MNISSGLRQRFVKIISLLVLPLMAGCQISFENPLAVEQGKGAADDDSKGGSSDSSDVTEAPPSLGAITHYSYQRYDDPNCELGTRVEVDLLEALADFRDPFARADALLSDEDLAALSAHLETIEWPAEETNSLCTGAGWTEASVSDGLNTRYLLWDAGKSQEANVSALEEDTIGLIRHYFLPPIEPPYLFEFVGSGGFTGATYYLQVDAASGELRLLEGPNDDDPEIGYARSWEIAALTRALNLRAFWHYQNAYGDTSCAAPDSFSYNLSLQVDQRNHETGYVGGCTGVPPALIRLIALSQYIESRHF